MRNRSSLSFTLLLVVADALAVLAAYGAAYVIRVKLSNVPAYYSDIGAHEFLVSLLILLPFIVVLFSLIGTYRRQPQKKLAAIGRIFFGAGGAMLFMIMIHYFMVRPLFPSKLVPIYGLILSIIFLSLERGLLYLARYLRRRRLIGVTNIVLIGDGKTVRDLTMDIKRDHNFKIQAIVGQSKNATHKTWRGAMRNYRPDIIIQVATSKQPDIQQEILDFAKENYIDFKFVPLAVAEIPESVKLELFMGDVPIMSLEPTALTGWGRVAKRLFDLIVGSLVLLVLSPIMLLVAIINRLIFGKAIFRQNRLTRGNQIFGLFKFQTVKKELNGLSPEAAFNKIGRPELAKQYRANGDFLADDPRYGRWARFLRKSSLDELPQLFNVIKGDISLVGPRALIPQELADYKNKHAILNVKSGITGLAQISGRKDLPWEQRRKLDIYYVQNWTFGLDIQILFKTIWQVLVGRGSK
jgi:lipopolysaccharide/colanic/teichoic acid biosynthesis glycosyltransferase